MTATATNPNIRNNGHANNSAKFDAGFDSWVDQASLPDLITQASEALNQLSKTRSDDNDQWLKVGMSLRWLGKDGLLMWDMWSRQSTKYTPDSCAQKWITFTPERI